MNKTEALLTITQIISQNSLFNVSFRIEDLPSLIYKNLINDEILELDKNDIEMAAFAVLIDILFAETDEKCYTLTNNQIETKTFIPINSIDSESECKLPSLPNFFDNEEVLLKLYKFLEYKKILTKHIKKVLSKYVLFDFPLDLSDFQIYAINKNDDIIKINKFKDQFNIIKTNKLDELFDSLIILITP